jgi:hypothetical protein
MTREGNTNINIRCTYSEEERCRCLTCKIKHEQSEAETFKRETAA